MNQQNQKINKIADFCVYYDPVEDWKDLVYDEIKDLPKDKIGQFLHQKVNEELND